MIRGITVALVVYRQTQKQAALKTHVSDTHTHTYMASVVCS